MNSLQRGFHRGYLLLLYNLPDDKLVDSNKRKEFVFLSNLIYQLIFLEGLLIYMTYYIRYLFTTYGIPGIHDLVYATKENRKIMNSNE